MLMKNILQSKIFQYLVALLLFFSVIYFYISPDDLKLIFEVNLIDSLLVILSVIAVYWISGFQYSHILKHYHSKKLSLFDTATLPITMNLWSLLIPFQGALIYTTFFLKQKYNTRLTTGPGVTLLAYQFTLVVTGAIGLALSFFTKLPVIFTVVSLLFVISPFFTYIGTSVLKKVTFPFVKAEKLKTKVVSLLEQVVATSKQSRFVAEVIGMNVLSLLSALLMYYLVAQALQLDLSFISILIYTLLLRLTVIIKLTPDNIGIQEIISVGIFSLINLPPEQGALITLYIRIMTIIVMLLGGGLSFYVNREYISLEKIIRLIRSYMNQSNG